MPKELTFIEELEFDLPKALTKRLAQLLDDMPSAPLEEASLEDIREEQGVYQLFKDGDLAYIGKTDSDAGLRKRLQRHCLKTSSRQNLFPQSVTFKAVRVYVFTAMDLESMLIKHYQELNGKIPWQNSGFGANDPGRRRDESVVKAEHFDAMYPIDLGVQVTIDSDSRTFSAAELLSQLKKKLSYLVRFESGKGRSPHADLLNTDVTVTKLNDSVRSFLVQASAALGAVWQITVLPGYIIVYREHKEYRSALEVL